MMAQTPGAAMGPTNDTSDRSLADQFLLSFKSFGSQAPSCVESLELEI